MSDRNENNLIEYSIIERAVGGDVEAIDAVIQHYSGYIAVLCRRYGYDKTGKVISYVDIDLVNRLETKLIVSILHFNLA